MGRLNPQIQAGGSALTTVREIMSTELVTIEPSANLTEAVHAMSAGRSGSVLVLQAGSRHCCIGRQAAS
jgi:CBS domain-containing protein